jgi:uncharacterized protein DUF3616
MKWIAGSGGALAVALALTLALRPRPPGGPATAPPSPAALAGAREPSPEDRATAQGWVQFEGACDASGAVPVDDRHFAVADDEDNVLRIYDARLGGPPIRQTNLSKQIALKKKGEADIEAATSLDGRAFWISSHARNAKGEADPNRSLIITTELPTLDARVQVEGDVYRNLLADLLTAPALSQYDFERASQLAPKEPGGLNIEGMTAAPDGKLWLGFRSPLPHGKALILPIDNPSALYTDGKVSFGQPIELALDGLGIRSLSWWRGSYLIAAGSASDGGPSRLYRWAGAGSLPRLVAESVFAGANPEAFFTAESNDEILVLSDDGTRRVHGKACKKLAGKKHKSFRGLWLKLAADKS